MQKKAVLRALALGVCGITLAAQQPSLRLSRVKEPRETAFTILVPAGWQFDGGVLRMNPLASNGPTNTVGAKFDFAVRDPARGSEMHWLPSVTYQDPRYQAMQFPVGSQYRGMLVQPLMPPESFLLQFVFPRQRPQARNVKVVDRKELPQLVARYQRAAPVMQGYGTFRYGALAITLTYDENGRPFKEKLVTVIEDTGQLGVGMWSNKDTLSVRAPATEFDRLAPLFALVQSSITLNPVWLDGERRGSSQRAAMARQTQQYIEQSAREIVENRRQANAEIAHSMWLMNTGQEDYINPHTGEVEHGTNQYKYRWQNANGDLIYTDDAKYDPKWDDAVKRSDYKKSAARPR